MSGLEQEEAPFPVSLKPNGWTRARASFKSLKLDFIHLLFMVYSLFWIIWNTWKWNICLPEMCLKILCESSQISSEFKIERDGKSKSQSFLGLAFSFLLTDKVGPSRSSHLTSLKCSYAFCFYFFRSRKKKKKAHGRTSCKATCVICIKTSCAGSSLDARTQELSFLWCLWTRQFKLFKHQFIITL